MSKYNTFMKIIKDPGKMVLSLSHAGLLNWLPDKLFLKMAYRGQMGKKLSLKTPQAFNEKIQWLKLYDRKPLYNVLVDKYEVKKYIANQIGNEIVIPTLRVWNTPEEIQIDQLPNRFVLKCTHDSGSVIICKNKETFKIADAKKELQRHLKKNPYWFGREWPYKNVKPRIIAEQYLEDENHQLVDYKIMCFNGEAKCCFVFSDRFSKSGMCLNVYDKKWNMLPVNREYTKQNPSLQKPENYEKMYTLAETIAKDTYFSRVDFYENKGKLFFGEITLYPNSGLTRFVPDEWDYIFGSWIELPKKTRRNK